MPYAKLNYGDRLYYIRVFGSYFATSLAKMDLLLVVNLNVWLANFAIYKIGNQLHLEVFPCFQLFWRCVRFLLFGVVLN